VKGLELRDALQEFGYNCSRIMRKKKAMGMVMRMVMRMAMRANVQGDQSSNKVIAVSPSPRGTRS
jgi:hypothetical protein